MDHGEPRLRVGPDRQVGDGACPHCFADIRWVRRAVIPGEASSDTDLIMVERLALTFRIPHGVVLVDDAVNPRIVNPSPYRMHECSVESVKHLAAGLYTAAVLAVTCPVEFCNASPARRCVSQRRDLLAAPHGARVALSQGVDWRKIDELEEVSLEDEL